MLQKLLIENFRALYVCMREVRCKKILQDFMKLHDIFEPILSLLSNDILFLIYLSGTNDQGIE